MTLFLRTLQTLTRSLMRKPITDINEVTKHRFRVLPIDIDVYRHMNHAKYLNYLEAARWDFQVRSGFLKLALKKGWIGPLAQVQIEYFRPLTLFRLFEVTTQFVAFEDKWLHILQRVWFFDEQGQRKEAARALFKSTIRKGRLNIPPDQYIDPLGFKRQELKAPEDLKDWLTQRMI